MKFYGALFLAHQILKDPARASLDEFSSSLTRSLCGIESLVAKCSNPDGSGTPREPTWRVISSDLYPLAWACCNKVAYLADFLWAASTKLVSKHSQFGQGQ